MRRHAPGARWEALIVDMTLIVEKTAGRRRETTPTRQTPHQVAGTGLLHQLDDAVGEAALAEEHLQVGVGCDALEDLELAQAH